MFFCRKKRCAETSQIFIKDMVVETAIGVFDEEKGRTQRVRINVIAVPASWPNPDHDNLAETVSYDNIVQIVLRLTQSGHHYHLVETLVDKIADACLGENPIRKITVRVEKLDIYPFAVAGAEIVRVAARRVR